MKACSACILNKVDYSDHTGKTCRRLERQLRLGGMAAVLENRLRQPFDHTGVVALNGQAKSLETVVE